MLTLLPLLLAACQYDSHEEAPRAKPSAPLEESSYAPSPNYYSQQSFRSGAACFGPNVSPLTVPDCGIPSCFVTAKLDNAKEMLEYEVNAPQQLVPAAFCSTPENARQTDWGFLCSLEVDLTESGSYMYYTPSTCAGISCALHQWQTNLQNYCAVESPDFDVDKCEKLQHANGDAARGYVQK